MQTPTQISRDDAEEARIGGALPAKPVKSRSDDESGSEPLLLLDGDSTKVVQGTAGTTEVQIRYTWNYAMLIAHGPSSDALIKSPIFRAMESGSIARSRNTAAGETSMQRLIGYLWRRTVACFLAGLFAVLVITVGIVFWVASTLAEPCR